MKIIVFTTLLVFCSSLQLIAQEKEVGRASYYGKKFHNKRTASGVVYHKDSLTCAHKTYPFGTLLLVTNSTNDKRVVVKVTDRGTLKKGRVIDLSYAAAKQIDLIRQGIAQVEITQYADSIKVGYEKKSNL